MRIIVLADHAVPEGGAPKVAIESAIGLRRTGHEVHFIHAVGGTADPRLAEAGVPTLALGAREVWDLSALEAARLGIWNAPLAATLAEALQRLAGPGTLVHLHQWTKAFSPSVFGAVRRAGLPLVLTLHDYFLACPTGLYFRFDAGMPCTLRPLSAACWLAPCDPKSRAHKLVRQLRGVAVARSTSGGPLDLIHVSRRSLDVMGPLLPAGARQHLVANPVEIAPVPMRDGAGDALVFAGRLTREKGAGLVAEVARRLGLPALFIGDGPLRGEIAATLPEAAITGWLPPQEATRLMRERARLLLAPSLWDETGPLTVYEAMAHGVAAIVSARAGAADRVPPGGGCVVPPQAEALEAAVAALFPGEKAAAAGREAHRAYWADPLSLERHLRALEPVYAGLLARA